MVERKIGRQHQIHYSSGEGEILCGVKKWQCSDTNWDNVECKFCLRKRDKLFVLSENNTHPTLKDLEDGEVGGSGESPKPSHNQDVNSETEGEKE